MNRTIRVFDKKIIVATIAFVLAVLIFGVSFYVLLERQTAGNTYYYFAPFCGVLSKMTGGSTFYCADTYDSFDSDNFSFGKIFAYLNEDENVIIVKYQSTYSGSDYDAFYDEYCKKERLFSDSLELETISGKSIFASKLGTQPVFSSVNGSSVCDSLVFSGEFPYEGKDRCFILKTKYSRLKFTLLPRMGETSIENLGFTSENDELSIKSLKIEGVENGKNGFYVTTLADETVFESINNLSDIVFLDVNGNDISSNFIGNAEFNTSFMRFDNNIFFFEYKDSYTCKEIKTMKYNLSTECSVKIDLSTVEGEAKKTLFPGCDITVCDFSIIKNEADYNTLSFNIFSGEIALNNVSVVINGVLKNKGDEYQVKRDFVSSLQKVGLHCDVKNKYTELEGIIYLDIGGIPLHVENKF